jgi:hypothetical protein
MPERNPDKPPPPPPSPPIPVQYTVADKTPITIEVQAGDPQVIELALQP